MKGWENVQAALSLGKGVVMTSAHFGNIEIVLYAMLMRGVAITIPTERIEPPELDDYLAALRMSKGLKLIAEDRAPYEREVCQLRLRDVHFVGYVPDEELARYYQSSHVFCAPSTGFESFGMVLLEAMAAGTPIVASDIEGYRTVISHRAQGLLVPPRDATSLADALICLLGRPDLRQAMSARGRATASRYGWDRVAERALNYYDEVLERKLGTSTAWNRQVKVRGVPPYRPASGGRLPVPAPWPALSGTKGRQMQGGGAPLRGKSG